MKKILVLVVLGAAAFTSSFFSVATAHDQVVVIPLMGNGVKCNGMLVGSRWCDNENGTVTDMTTSLIWLKKLIGRLQTLV